MNHTKCDSYCKTMFNVLFLTSKSWANSKGWMYTSSCMWFPYFPMTIKVEWHGMSFCASSNVRTIGGHGHNEALKRGVCINNNYACKKKTFLAIGINIEFVKIINLLIS